jgi:hypothetical protein
MDLICASRGFFAQQDQQQQQMEVEEEVLVPHQELPNGTQAMQGSAYPCRLVIC